MTHPHNPDQSVSLKPEAEDTSIQGGRTSANDGGQAFPFVGWKSPDGMYAMDVQRGMTLRDYFAGQALVGMMQAMRPYSNDFERNAREAYVQADAMLKAREA